MTTQRKTKEKPVTHVSEVEELSKKNSSTPETKKIVTHVSETKKKTLAELLDLIKKKRTILIASIKNLPASQFQEIGKKLRGKAIVKVPKKNLMFMALDKSGNETAKKLQEQIKSDFAILFSDLDAFDLAAELVKGKIPAKAKPGQISPEDIEIQPGPTSLMPGPAVSDLGAAGIKIEIKEGKIHIKEGKKVVKAGQKVSQAAADIMSKLDIKPFSIGFVPIAAFDAKEGKIYLDIKINRDETVKALKEAYSKALAFAVEIAYTSKDTIKFLIGKAGMQERAIERLLSNTSDAHKLKISGTTESNDSMGNKSGEEK